MITNDLGQVGAGGAKTDTDVVSIFVAEPAPAVLNLLWVNQIHRDLFGRDPLPGELAALTAQLNQGADRGQIVRQITRTLEYQLVTLRRLFEQTLGRPASEGELNRALRLLDRGATYQYVTAAIIAGVRPRREFLDLFASLFTSGRLNRRQKARLRKITKQSQTVINQMRLVPWVRPFVANLVQRFLNRPATADELLDYTGRMIAGSSDTRTPASLQLLRGEREEQIIAAILSSKAYLEVL